MGGEADPTRGAEQLARGCEDGISNACTHLGTLYEKGYSVAADVAPARAWYVRGCSGGDSRACRAPRALTP